MGVFGLLAAWVICFPARAAESSASISQPLRALTLEYQSAQAEFSRLYREAKTDAEREKLRSEKMPDPQNPRFAPRIWELAQRDPKDPAALEALVWLATTGYQTGEAGQALNLLARHHATSDKMLAVCGFVPYISSDAGGEFLRAVMEMNPKREIQAQACRNLYNFSLVSDPSQAEKYLQLLAEKFGDVSDGRGPIGDFVRSEQEHNRTFGIGKLAPETEGEDIDGQKFKLSDYRGKVVVIDFWGDW